MRQDEPHQVFRVAPDEPGNRWKRDGFVGRSRKRKAKVEYEASAVGYELDARAADLGSAATDAGPHSLQANDYPLPRQLGLESRGPKRGARALLAGFVRPCSSRRPQRSDHLIRHQSRRGGARVLGSHP